MKLKGINPLEQHVEKMVLGAMGVVFLGVLAVQFVIAPNEVDYDGQKVPPDKVLTRLGDRASGVLGQMLDPAPALPSVETPDLAARFEAAFSTPPLPGEQLASVAFGRPFELAFTEVQTLDGPVTPLTLPGAAEVHAIAQWSTIDPFFAVATPALAPYLPPEQPMDKATVSVEAVISGSAIKAALERREDGGRAIPSHWWQSGGQGALEVLAVEVERQSLRADGSWSPPEIVPQIRWTPDLLASLNEGAPQGETRNWENLRPADLSAMARMALDDPSLVAQPMFLPTIAGVEWVAPSKAGERQARAEDEARMERLEREIAEIQETIAQIQERRSGARQTGVDPGGGGRSSNPGIIITGPSSGPSRPGANRPQRPDPIERRIESLNRQIDDKRDQIDVIAARLADDPADPAGRARQSGGRQTAGGRGVPPTDPSQQVIIVGAPTDPRSMMSDDPTSGQRQRGPRAPRAERIGPLLDQEKFQVWSHDLTVEPGATYRYRVRYAVNNPLFGRERSLGSEDPDLVALAKQPLVLSPWTDWTAPVAVGRESYFFVTSAREEGALNQRTAAATAEVYRMFYGYYRKHTITLTPGDPVQGEFRLPEDLPLFDVRTAKQSEIDAYFTERDAQSPARTPAAPPGTIVVGGAPAAQPDAPPVPRPWLSYVPSRLSLTVDAVMLDVAEFPLVEDPALVGTQPRRLYEVFFFDNLSGVVARRPDRDRNMGEYAMVERSAGLAGTAEIRRPAVDAIP
jgi:hypothetical protein